MVTLQDVLDAVGTNPERYGRRGWYFYKGTTQSPWCPLAVEVIQNLETSHSDMVREAAAALGCSLEEIRDFILWWDGSPEAFARTSRSDLERRGYRVPPDEVRTRARGHKS